MAEVEQSVEKTPSPWESLHMGQISRPVGRRRRNHSGEGRSFIEKEDLFFVCKVMIEAELL
ncbi:hypothetical protein GBA52_024429 [Prunus armeniaca]|nr:hypothetical protein GBA52_024429 [Prunus armeniaca]